MSGVAIVTGATRGIGLALAEAMLARGMTVYAVGVDPTRVAALATRLPHPELHPRRVDVADGAAFEALTHEVQTNHGRIDWVVNNAGLVGGGELADMTEAQTRKLVDVNLWGVLTEAGSPPRSCARSGAGGS
jgi:NADP-dependent 3-hydroxy acid dehydrogenase YdfG